MDGIDMLAHDHRMVEQLVRDHHAPDQPPALAIAVPAATVHDRMRDRLQGRPRT